VASGQLFYRECLSLSPSTFRGWHITKRHVCSTHTSLTSYNPSVSTRLILFFGYIFLIVLRRCSSGTPHYVLSFRCLLVTYYSVSFVGCSQSLVRKFLGIRTPARILIFTDPYPKICRPVVVRKKSFITGCRNRNTHGLEISSIVQKSDRFAPGPQKMRSQKLLIPALFLSSRQINPCEYRSDGVVTFAAAGSAPISGLWFSSICSLSFFYSVVLGNDCGR
jgi:hypothetical protein